jgi:magnesium transporter
MEKRRIIEKIRELIESGNPSDLKNFLESLSPADTARSVTDITEEEREKLFSVLLPGDAASVLRDMPDSQAADVIGELHPGKAADIVEEMSSADRADVLNDMSDNAADAILDEMEPEEAADARMLLEYPENTAGGIMLTEFLAYTTEKTVNHVLEDMKNKREKYKQYVVQYIYITSPSGKLEGVLKVRDLVLEDPNSRLCDIMLKNPICVDAGSGLEKLISIFSEHNFLGLPVIDPGKRLVGIILRHRLQEAVGEFTSESFLKVSGIVGGEEFRSMKISRRISRRLS